MYRYLPAGPLVKFFQERFLYRLSKSDYRTNFLLKGGALAYTIGGEDSRHTKDIDFLLTQLSSDSDQLKKIFEEIVKIKGNDGVLFLPQQMKVETITKEGNYQGTRLIIPARLGKISERVQVDIGVGDRVTPGPQEIVYPVILAELEEPRLLAYSLETLVAEKFNAMIDLGVYNSRMKDFYDVHQFAEMCDEYILKEAIENTFQRRKTLVSRNHPVFQDDFYTENERLKLWNMFLKKNQLSEIKFTDVQAIIIKCLMPIYEKLN
jgi:predicted nucleotidyltransferase component of viral defense system